MTYKLRETNSLENHLLIATPALNDPNFYRAVIYICEHDETGAMGLIINKPLKMKLNEVLEQLQIKNAQEWVKEQPVLMGGPLGPEQGFIIHHNDKIHNNLSANNKIKSKRKFEDEVIVSVSKDSLEALAVEPAPQQLLVSLGYSAWTPGQLEQEIIENSWIVAPAFTEILFETPLSKRWATAAAFIGVDFTHLSGDVGHA